MSFQHVPALNVTLWNVFSVKYYNIYFSRDVIQNQEEQKKETILGQLRYAVAPSKGDSTYFKYEASFYSY